MEKEIKLLDKLKQYTIELRDSYLKTISLVAEDSMDSQKIIHIKRGERQIIEWCNTILQRMEGIEITIINMCSQIEKTNDLNERSRIIREAEYLITQLKEDYQRILSKHQLHKQFKKTLNAQREIKERVINLIEKKGILSMDNLEECSVNIDIVNLPQEKIIGKNLTFRYEDSNIKLDITFQILAIDNQNQRISLLPIIEKDKIAPHLKNYYETKLEPNIRAIYQNIPLKIIKTSIASRILKLRRDTQNWIITNRTIFQQYEEKNIRELLSLYGVFTPKEIDNMLKGIIETSPMYIMRLIRANEYKLQKKLKKLSEEQKPPQDYEKEFAVPLQQLITMINKTTLPPNEKASALKSVDTLIILPIIQELKRFTTSGRITNETWARWIIQSQTEIQRLIQQSEPSKKTIQNIPQQRKLAA